MFETAAYVLVPAFLVIAGVLLLTRRAKPAMPPPATVSLATSAAARLIERNLRPGQWLAVRLDESGDLEIIPIEEETLEEKTDAKEVPGRDGVGGVEGPREPGQAQG